MKKTLEITKTNSTQERYTAKVIHANGTQTNIGTQIIINALFELIKEYLTRGGYSFSYEGQPFSTLEEFKQLRRTIKEGK